MRVGAGIQHGAISTPLISVNTRERKKRMPEYMAKLGMHSNIEENKREEITFQKKENLIGQ